MTIQKNVPLHGGTVRVAFNGGETIRKSLPFNAVSVNVDNWSPYWYKLNPIEVYIPPFQNGLNIRLNFINNFEFVCESPPGIEQSDIIPSTALSGNNDPIIAVFSSFETNNDSGMSALDSAANIAVPLTNVSGFVSGSTLTTIDVTLYNGLYFYIKSNGNLGNGNYDIEILYDDSNGSYSTYFRYTMYSNESLLFTIPKISKHIRIQLLNAVPGPNIDFSYSYRPFQGYANFAIERTSSAGALPPSLGAIRSITGNGSTAYSVDGIDNAMISIKPRTAGAVVFGTVFWVQIILGNYADSLGGLTIYAKSFQYGMGITGLLIPIFNLLQRQASSITVQVNTTLGTTVTDVSIHHVDKPADFTDYFTPVPYTVGALVLAIPNGTTNLVALPVGGKLTGVLLTVRVASATAGAYVAMYAGTGAFAFVLLGIVSGNVVGSTLLNEFRDIPLSSGFSNIWVVTNSVAGLDISYTAYLD